MSSQENLKTIALDDLEIQLMRAYREWHLLSLGSAGIGIGLAIIGYATTSLGLTSLDLSKVLLPIIADIVSALAFVQMKAVRKSVERIQAERDKRRQLEAAIQAASEISDEKTRNEALVEVIREFSSPHSGQNK